MPNEKSADRRQRIDELKRQEQAADRRRNLLFGGIGGLIALAIVGGSLFAVQRTEANKPENRDLNSFGVAAAAAACDDVLRTASSGVNNHVSPTQPDGKKTVVDYTTVPPAFGPHYGAPAPFERGFYTERDRPAIEELVHNLEHGYVIVWYDPAVSDDDQKEIQGVVTKLRTDNATAKIIASPWDDAYGALPDGKTVALSHWGVKNGSRQLCGAVSGEAINAFVKAHPPTDSPEPNAA
jgi:hypothetical protein